MKFRTRSQKKILTNFAQSKRLTRLQTNSKNVPKANMESRIFNKAHRKLIAVKPCTKNVSSAQPNGHTIPG